ncbi:MAG: DNA repair protein RecO [Patescibacteria group bacterium]
MKIKSYSTEAIVIKRSNLGEADRVVTLLTADQGKVVCIAKGVRNIKSSQRAILEPGNVITAFLSITKSLPILAQSRPIENNSQARSSLSKIRQLSQVLEIFDQLFMEGDEDLVSYNQAKKIIQTIQTKEKSASQVRHQLRTLLMNMGFDDPNQSNHASILDFVSEIAERKMKSFEYLRVN